MSTLECTRKHHEQKIYIECSRQLYDHDDLKYINMLMLVYVKCMLARIKSWHDKNISMGRTMEYEMQ